MSIEAMNQALEALELAACSHDVMLLTDPPQDAWKARSVTFRVVAAMQSLRAAIAEASMQRLTDVQQEMEQEPVAWMWDYKRLDGHVETKAIFAHHYKNSPGDLAYVLKGRDATPLYTHPPRREWVGLTDDEIDSVVPYCHNEFDLAEFKDFAGAIESALKEKNS